MADIGLAYLWFLLVFLPIAVLVFLYLIVRPRPVHVPIKGRHVFITGGSSGIGLALAHQAASEGAKVSILARSLDKLTEAKNAIRLATGIDVAVFAADVRDYDAVRRAVDEAGPIDVLVVNQGVFVPQELEKQELDQVRFMVDVNLMGSFNMIKAALPSMKKRSNPAPASIALMSSQAGQVRTKLRISIQPSSIPFTAIRILIQRFKLFSLASLGRWAFTATLRTRRANLHFGV